MKNLVASRHSVTSPRRVRIALIPWSSLLVIVGCGGAVAPGSAMQMAEGSVAGSGSVNPNGTAGASVTGSMTTEPTSMVPTDDDRTGTTGETGPTDDTLPNDTLPNDTLPGDNGEVPTDDEPPANDTTSTPPTPEELRAAAEANWIPLDIAPVDCTSMDFNAAAVAHPEDFSPARSATSTDHELVMDLGGVVRRVDSYLTLPATDGHQHELVFADEALEALLNGVSVQVSTLIPALGAADGHGHVVTVHSCDAYSSL